MGTPLEAPTTVVSDVSGSYTSSAWTESHSVRSGAGLSSCSVRKTKSYQLVGPESLWTVTQSQDAMAEPTDEAIFAQHASRASRSTAED